MKEPVPASSRLSPRVCRPPWLPLRPIRPGACCNPSPALPGSDTYLSVVAWWRKGLRLLSEQAGVQMRKEQQVQMGWRRWGVGVTGILVPACVDPGRSFLISAKVASILFPYLTRTAMIFCPDSLPFLLHVLPKEQGSVDHITWEDERFADLVEIGVPSSAAARFRLLGVACVT